MPGTRGPGPRARLDVNEPAIKNVDASRHSAPKPVGFVIDRFWPYSDTTVHVVGALASKLCEEGQPVQIFTTRPNRDWPAQFHFREIPVFRISRRPRNKWAVYRTAREFSRRLSTDRLSGVFLCGIDGVIQGIVRSIAGQLPALIYVNRQLAGSSLDRHAVRRIGTWTGPLCRFLTDCASVHEEICELIDPQSVELIAPASDVFVEHRTVAGTAAARSALSDAHPVMMIDAGQPLALAFCDSPRDRGCLDLVTAWAQVVRVVPRAKLWLVGDGPLAPELWSRVRDLDIAHSVAMPGHFDDVTDLFRAADLFVHPARLADHSFGLVRAMGHGCCVVATETEWTHGFLEKHVNSLVAPRGNPSALAQAILFGFEQAELRTRLGLAASATARRRFHLDAQSSTIRRLLKLPATTTRIPS